MKSVLGNLQTTVVLYFTILLHMHRTYEANIVLITLILNLPLNQTLWYKTV